MKKLIMKLFAGVCVTASILASVAGAATVQAAQRGWVYNPQQKFYNYYGTDGRKYIGWHYMTKKEGESKDHWNYFASDGKLYTGWQWMDAGEGEKTPHWSYFGDNGWLRTGWIRLGKGTAESDGNTAIHWSYFGANGWLRTGWVQLGKGTSEPDGNTAKHWSYFGVNGWLRNGMQEMSTTANPDGGAARHKSYFGNNGWLVTDKTFTHAGVSYKADGRGWLSEVKKANPAVNNTQSPAPAVKYTIKFTDGNGNIITTVAAEKGKYVPYPENPKREGYIFIGWDKSFYKADSDMTINAKWEKIPSIDEIRKNILSEVNKERKAAGKSTLKLNDMLNETAQEKAKDMADENELDHYSVRLGYFYNQFNRYGISSYNSAENIAYTGGFRADVAMSGWMNSKGHKENILEDSFTDLGVGYHNGYWVQQFATNPVKTEAKPAESGKIISCPHCNKELNRNYLSKAWKIDSYGNFQIDGYGLSKYYLCDRCGGKFYLCPECDDEVLKITGKDAQTGVNTYKCGKCGFIPSSYIISSCNSCGKKINEHLAGQWYTLHFQYSGAEKDFQEIGIYIRYCPESEKYNFVNDDDEFMYRKYYEIMKGNYQSHNDIIKNITWYKEITKNGKISLVKVNTPYIKNLREIIGMDLIK